MGVTCLLLSLLALDQQRPCVSLAAASTGPAPLGNQCAEAAEAHAASSAALCWSDMERLKRGGQTVGGPRRYFSF